MAPSANKKRQATTTRDHNKKSKIEDPSPEAPQKGGLFDDLDEEMDPTVLDSVMEQLNNSDQSDDDEDSDGGDNNDDDDDDDDIPELDPVSDLLHQDQSDIEDEQKDDSMVTGDDNDTQSGPEQVNKPVAGKFRDHYMGQLTRAFGSDLDTVRQEPGFTPSRLNVLIDSLEAGIDIFSDLEKTIALANEN